MLSTFKEKSGKLLGHLLTKIIGRRIDGHKERPRNLYYTSCNGRDIFG